MNLLLSGSRESAQVVPEGDGAAANQTGYSFPRVNVQLNQTLDRAKQKPLALLGVLLVLTVIAGVGFLTLRSWRAATPLAEQAIVTPSPTPTPSPRLRQHQCASPKREQPRQPLNANKKKESKVGSALKKVKRILKKPF